MYSQGPAATQRPAETRWPRLEGDPRCCGSDKLGPGAELHCRPEQCSSVQRCYRAELHPRASLCSKDHYHRRDEQHRICLRSTAELCHRARSHQPHHPEILSYLWGPDCQSLTGKQCVGIKHVVSYRKTRRPRALRYIYIYMYSLWDLCFVMLINFNVCNHF